MMTMPVSGKAARPQRKASRHGAALICAATLAATPAYAAGLFGGPWNTTFGHLFIDQNGPVATATYGNKGGHLEGRVRGLHFKGTFSQSRSRHPCRQIQQGHRYWGHFDIFLTKHAQEFHGVRAFCDQPLAQGQAWTGKRDHEGRL